MYTDTFHKLATNQSLVGGTTTISTNVVDQAVISEVGAGREVIVLFTITTTINPAATGHTGITFNIGYSPNTDGSSPTNVAAVFLTITGSIQTAGRQYRLVIPATSFAPSTAAAYAGGRYIVASATLSGGSGVAGMAGAWSCELVIDAQDNPARTFANGFSIT